VHREGIFAGGQNEALAAIGQGDGGTLSEFGACGRAAGDGGSGDCGQLGLTLVEAVVGEAQLRARSRTLTERHAHREPAHGAGDGDEEGQRAEGVSTELGVRRNPVLHPLQAAGRAAVMQLFAVAHGPAKHVEYAD
jgi:hypothetical protein